MRVAALARQAVRDAPNFVAALGCSVLIVTTAMAVIDIPSAIKRLEAEQWKQRQQLEELNGNLGRCARALERATPKRGAVAEGPRAD